MPDWIAVVLLGLIEGVTEFLPVSSTGHLLIAEQWLGKRTDLFNTVIQAGAMLAVLAVFSRRALEMVKHSAEPRTRDYLLKLALAFGITAAGGLVMKKGLHFELPKTAIPVALATLIGGVIILLIERGLRNKTSTIEIAWSVAWIVGGAQLLAAVFPGTSRSGACILFALMAGVARPAATEFSFLVGIPTMLAASGWEILSAFRHGEKLGGSEWGLVLLGSATAAVSAFLVVRWLLRFVQSHTFVGFGYYRILLGSLILVLAKLKFVS